MCSSLNNEKVYFRQNGFKHLLYKGREVRKPSDQIRRLRLLRQVRNIVASHEVLIEYRKSRNKFGTQHYWALKKRIKSKLVTVVIRQLNMGEKHFYSVFS